MSEQESEQRVLRRVKRRLSEWREQHGGRGRPIPAELWKEAASVARSAGVEQTARELRVDRHRLRRLAGPESAPMAEVSLATPSKVEFVQMDAGLLCPAREPSVVHLEGRDGERVRIELHGGAAEGVVALARAFWSRGR